MGSLRAKYTENTRQVLLEAGRQMFATRDYAELPAEELVQAAGLTRGALYHHFDGKRGLFEEVFNCLEYEAAQQIQAAMDAGVDPLDRAERGAAEFLVACADPVYRHIVLLQGPIALGHQRWRELDQEE